MLPLIRRLRLVEHTVLHACKLFSGQSIRGSSMWCNAGLFCRNHIARE
jgi:hypothetical protein